MHSFPKHSHNIVAISSYVCTEVCLKSFHIHTVQAEITDEIIDLLENETLPITFTCQAVGEPVPNISWHFNSAVINASDASKYNISNSNNGIVVKSFLIIMNVQSSDVGTYTCYAENIIGSDRSSGVLTVNGKYICILLLY